MKQKFSKLGLVTSESLVGRGVEPGIASILAGTANFGLSNNTWESYQCIINNLRRCQEAKGQSMDLPFTLVKMLTFTGWMIERGLKASSMNSYISALRMYHIAMGYNEPVLRDPIVKLILKGKSNWDAVKKKIAGEVGRLPVTSLVLKMIKRNALKATFDPEEKIILWAICTVLWCGSFRVHEIVSRYKCEYDPQSTLLWEDIKVSKVTLNGKAVTALGFRIKSPKVDRVGTGDYVEIYETGLYNCPVKAFLKWRGASGVSEDPKMPVFRIKEGCCYTSQQLNMRLGELTRDLKEHIKGGEITSHSFRAGVASEMCRAGYSESDIQAVGRWASGSQAYKLYCKLPRMHRARMARNIACL